MDERVPDIKQETFKTKKCGYIGKQRACRQWLDRCEKEAERRIAADRPKKVERQGRLFI